MTDIKFPKSYPITKTSDDDDGSPTCKVEIKGNCFLLTLKTAENTLGYKSVTALMEALNDIETYYWKEREEQKATRYLITTAEGKKFSNGLDLESIIDVGPEKFNKHANKMFLKFLKLPIPTIAALNGHCFAAGGVLAFVHDFRVMRTEKGFFCMNEVELNLTIPPAINTLFRLKLRDYSVFQKIFLLGHRFNAEEALDHGLVNAIAPIDKLIEKAMEFGELYGAKLAIGGDIYSYLRADYLKEVVKDLELSEMGEYYSKL